MISIVCANSAPHHLEQLHEWFVAEWGKVDPFEGLAGGVTIPMPLLLTDDEKLIGGLAFTSAPKPNGEEIGVWVNALLVLPDYRKKGLASILIKEAESQAKKMNIKEMFAYTDIPVLYQKQGWHIADDSKESIVLKKVIGP